MAERLVLDEAAVVNVFGAVQETRPGVLVGETFVTQHDVQLQFAATTLGLHERSDGSWQVTGNTVPRLCEAAKDCSAIRCGLAELAIENDLRRSLNCAAANTEPAFGNRPGFVMTPTSPDVVFLSDPDSYTTITALDENGNDTLLFNKVRAGSALVISEHDMVDIPDSENGIFVGLNLADSVVATQTLEFEGTRYVVVLYSSRENLGDREERFQIARNAVDGILDRVGLLGEEYADIRAQSIAELTVQIDVGFSATLRNFAHEVRVPEIDLPEGMTADQALDIMHWEDRHEIPEAQRNPHVRKSRYALQLAERNLLIDVPTGELVGEITPTMVMDDQYPRALEEGEIYGQYEAENGIDVPRGPGGCPGHGELCHIDYPKITRRTRVGELVRMGIPEESITYNNDKAIDPSAQDNMLPSNRRMQLEGVRPAKTLRTVQGVAISFPPRDKSLVS